MIAGAPRRAFHLLSVLWVAANCLFWWWWLQPERVDSPWLYAVFTLAWAYEVSFLPTMYLYFVGRMHHPRPCRAPAGLNVALITLCVPSQETLEVIVRQLEALSRVGYPHESWILDEEDDPAVGAAARRLGVRYFSRKGVHHYNQAVAPFKARTKAGNVNAWLAEHGHRYDVFVQFDIDHRPRPDYLDRVLGYFCDRSVAWVQAPSLYGNLDNWIARGAAEQELVLQGPLQRGFYGHSQTPFIIGSHCSYRTTAVLEIGGFQPTRAEDHLDTVMLAARGYRGVFVPEVLALGAGPETFETYLRQQFAWALSMMQVLFGYTPRLLRRYRPRQAAQFLFAQTWYPLWSTSMLALFSVPLLALLTGQQPATAPLPLFAAAAAPLQLAAFVIWRWTRCWQLPAGLGLSWRGVVLHIARWPIVFWALLNIVLRVRHPYMITPKGERGGLPAFRLRNQAIYLVGAALSLAAVWQYLVRDPDDVVAGYALFALLGAAYLLAVVLTNVTADLAWLGRRGVQLRHVVRLRHRSLGVVLAAVALLGGTTQMTAERLFAAATWTGTPVETTPGAAAAREALLAPGSQPADRPGSTRWASTTAELVRADSPVVWGAYDPWQDLADQPLSLEHWYVRQDEPTVFADALAHAADRLPLITIEPFPRHRRSLPVLDRTIAGQADEDLRALARIVRGHQDQPVLLRWGHEMDLAGLYPWSANDPARFRSAFRHVVSIFRAEGATNARWVWSPAGEPGATAFYPGDDVVDYVGLTVLGDEEWDWELGFERRSFADLLAPRYAEVVRLAKPILIAELGTSGTADEQTAWLDAGLRSLAAFPSVRALIYFDDRNAPNNRRTTEPNWRVEPGQVSGLLAPVARPGSVDPSL